MIVCAVLALAACATPDRAACETLERIVVAIEGLGGTDPDDPATPAALAASYRDLAGEYRALAAELDPAAAEEARGFADVLDAAADDLDDLDHPVPPAELRRGSPAIQEMHDRVNANLPLGLGQEAMAQLDACDVEPPGPSLAPQGSAMAGFPA